MRKTIVLSDLHLGSKSCDVKSLRSVLHANETSTIVLAGDIVDSTNYGRLKSSHWDILDFLRGVPDAGGLLVLIHGNHDGDLRQYKLGPGSILGLLLDCQPWGEQQIDVFGKKYLITHGDRFDPALHWPLLTDAADWVYQKTQSLSRKAAKHLKRFAKSYGGIVTMVKRGAVEEAKRRGFGGVILGHTHYPDSEMIDGIHYLNCGSWTCNEPTYVEIDGGTPKLVYVS